MKKKSTHKIIFLRIVFWKSYKDYNDEPKKRKRSLDQDLDVDEENVQIGQLV